MSPRYSTGKIQYQGMFQLSLIRPLSPPPLPTTLLGFHHDDTTACLPVFHTLALGSSQLPPLHTMVVPHSTHREQGNTLRSLRQGRILVSEGTVLLRVQNLQEGSSWVTLETLLLERERKRERGRELTSWSVFFTELD